MIFIIILILLDILVLKFASNVKKNNNLKQLDLVHITKTGGTSVEDWGAQNHIKWSYRNVGYLKKFKRTKFMGKACWHTPPKYFPINPYENKITFMIVRNPYTRLISEYYCPWSGSKQAQLMSKVEFNMWIRNLIQKNDVVSGLPQYLYLPVNHVIYFENLQNDFSNLLKRYEITLDPTLPHSNKSKFKGSRFSINDFEKKTIQMINRKYYLDFKIFNYQMINV